mmetsp:Transcript_14232/g.17926  ORF Transcript_14232/g.17926 Transcript_14232/m.17926 type:complete len:424 (-) Transcript_14232:114-1385(-)|eukprot:CAMPEP_0172494788 /NCGR_PEP_ID=MMETSP1066-20121228/56946_1 /TAXON_ID=671091 /ORGANISM="Coscinodiscus wailesii, Strain CCMP2513" /LENGTH=423 /DNA_ID=CAMNT_0013266053 /DNA_START=101 /DNA_END=1372 /DNA_ORIENTATION=-
MSRESRGAQRGNSGAPPFGGYTPATDEFGLPLFVGQAQAVTLSSDGPLAEGSNMRSVDIAESSTPNNCFDFGMLPPPSLTSPQSKLESSFTKSAVSIEANSSTWVLPEGSMKPVPEYYPLEQTAVFIEGDDPAHIAARVSDCLRRRSIAASYGDVKAKAKCKTEDGVEFRIRMFYGRGDYNHGVIVEVQRRDGWSPRYQQDVYAILESAEDAVVNDFDVSLPPIDDLINDMQDNDFDQAHSTECTNPIPCHMVLSNNTDVQAMGMLILSSITDMTKAGAVVALKNASNFVHGEQEVEVRNMVLETLLKKKEGYEIALRIISNCVEVMAKESVLALCMLEEEWIMDTLLPNLVKELRHASNTPNEAALAAKCLGNIMSASPEAGQKALALGAVSALSGANGVGTVSHFHLEKEASRAVAILECF